jgi:hypothetical protein
MLAAIVRSILHIQRVCSLGSLNLSQDGILSSGFKASMSSCMDSGRGICCLFVIEGHSAYAPPQFRRRQISERTPQMEVSLTDTAFYD